MPTSNTFTLNEQLVLLLLVSVAVQVTVVVPMGKIEPDGGTQTALTPGQLSVATVAVKLTTIPVVFNGHCAGTTAVRFGEQAMAGACVSLTVTVNEHILVLADESLTEQVTVVVPFGKNEPEAGEQDGTPTPGQLSPTLGAG
jgi:hypothetical protein